MIINIDEELKSQDAKKLSELQAQTTAIKAMTQEQIDRQGAVLDKVWSTATERTQRVLDQMDAYHQEFNNMVMAMATEGKLTQNAYINYLVQAWYHTKYTPEFEMRFGEKLSEFVQNDKELMESGNKFIRMVKEEADEELGHELWALEDIKTIGGRDSIDLLKDVWPETRALVRTQFDRLNRLNFKGFLGYSFYLEFWVARYAKMQLEAMKGFGIDRNSSTFLYNHYVVDQGHAADNIELLNFLMKTDEDVDDVLDNMAVIHALYFRMIRKCFD